MLGDDGFDEFSGILGIEEDFGANLDLGYQQVKAINGYVLIGPSSCKKVQTMEQSE